MKKFSITILCILFIFLIILEPHLVSNGVQEGIKLCLYQVIPSLLPLILVTSIMIQQDSGKILSKIFYPILHIIYRLTPNGCFAMIISFLSGFPIGAKTISHLYETSRISLAEASHLMTFCNNCSISFLVNYVGIYCLRGCVETKILLFLTYIPPLLTGFINRFFFHYETSSMNIEKEYTNIIIDTLLSLGKICTYVICFSVIVNLLQHTDWNQIEKISAILEITTGVFCVTKDAITSPVVCSVIVCCVFGGLCTMFQAFSFIHDNLLKKYYILGKFEQIIIVIIMLLLLR